MRSILSSVGTRAIFGPALLAWAVSTCATNPVTGKKELSFVSESQEISMGREYAGQVSQEMGVYPDSAVQRYVSGIGKELAVRTERPKLPWTFTVMDDPQVNAFALPGGFIFITRGIMTHMNSEAELATVVGHEIGHVTARHSVQQMTRQQLAQIGLVVQFYHPLVHWLVARLRLQQELAADAVGAPLAGGRSPYLIALSRLALRPNENPLAWPARSFLPAGSHLIRRIQMLKENAQEPDRTLSTLMRICTMTLLTLVAAVAVAYRGPAPARAVETRPAAGSTNRQASQAGERHFR